MCSHLNDKWRGLPEHTCALRTTVLNIHWKFSSFKTAALCIGITWARVHQWETGIENEGWGSGWTLCWSNYLVPQSCRLMEILCVSQTPRLSLGMSLQLYHGPLLPLSHSTKYFHRTSDFSGSLLVPQVWRDKHPGHSTTTLVMGPVHVILSLPLSHHTIQDFNFFSIPVHSTIPLNLIGH